MVDSDGSGERMITVEVSVEPEEDSEAVGVLRHPGAGSELELLPEDGPDVGVVMGVLGAAQDGDSPGVPATLDYWVALGGASVNDLEGEAVPGLFVPEREDGLASLDEGSPVLDVVFCPDHIAPHSHLSLISSQMAMNIFSASAYVGILEFSEKHSPLSDWLTRNVLSESSHS